MRSALAGWNREYLSDQLKLSQKDTEWHLSTPAAPHMGEIWERMVASVKRALRAVLGRVIVSEETMNTVIVEVESIVNNRPLTHVSTDGTDLEAITLNHILFGHLACSLPPGLHNTADLPCKRSWREAQCISGQFWRRWRREHVPCLTQRGK